MIQFKNVSKQFGDKQLITNVSFTVNEGELTTLVGPNGAGKTTIARLILGLEKQNSGEIKISPGLKIGYVPQKSDFTSDLPITAKNFLQLLSKNSLSKAANGLAEFLDFDRYKDTDISALSGGQFQKLLLTATLLNKPNLIILDEPTQSLDVTSQQEFYRIINKIKNIFAITIFMVSHDLFTVMKNSDQVICLNGHICCSGKPDQLSNDQYFFDALSSIGLYRHRHDHKH